MAGSRRGAQRYIALLLVLAIIVLSIGTYLRWWNLWFIVGPIIFPHWLGYIGALYLAVFTPIYAVLKRRYPARMRTLLSVHVFGNLLAFLLISVHYAHHLGRPPEAAPTLGTGLTLYIIVIIMVATGLMQWYRLGSRLLRTWRFVHIGLSLSFYILVSMHILITLGKI